MLNRREFLKKIIEPLEKPEHQDQTIEIGSEALIVILALYTAYEGGKNQVTRVTPVPVETLQENPILLNEFNKKLGNIQNILNNIHAETENLAKKWEDLYYKTRTNIVVTIDSEGNPKTDIETEQYWDEPEELKTAGLDNAIIRNFELFIGHLIQKLNNLRNFAPNAAPINKNGNDSYRFEKTSIDLTSRNILATIGLGSVGVFFAFYEELYSHLLQEKRYYRWTPKISEKYIKRRSLLKVVLGSIAMIPASKINTRTQEAANKAEVEIKRLTKQEIDRQRNLTNHEAFQNYFGTTTQDIISRINNFFAIIDTIIDSSSQKQTAESWDNILPYLTNIRNNFPNYEKWLDDLFLNSDNFVISDEFDTVLKNTLTDIKIKEQSNNVNAHPSLDALIQIITLLLSLSGVALTTEGINYVTERLRDSN